MTVRYGSPDSFAFVEAVYVCGCGRTADRHGRHAGVLPPGWVELAGENEPGHACPECAPRPEPDAQRSP